MTPFVSWLLENSLWSGISLLIVVGLCRLFPRLPANMRCWLLRLAFLKCLISLFIPLAITVPILPPPTTDLAAPIPSTEVLPAKMSPIQIPATIDDFAARPEPAPLAHAPLPTLTLTLTTLYFAGLTLSLLRLTVAGYHTWRLVRTATPVAHPVLLELAPRFGRKTLPSLARTSKIATPLLAFNTILLPEATGTDERLLLAHELAHLQRRDLVWEWFGALTQTLLWFHPLVYLARREERLACEQSADQLVLAVCGTAPADYARVLLSASLQHSGQAPALSVGAVTGGSRLRRRLEALARPGFSRRRVLAFGGLALLIATLSILPWRATARQNVRPNQPAAVPGAQKENILSGTITDDQGKPVANARVSWVISTYQRNAITSQVIASTVTDALGMFRFDKSPLPTKPGETLQDQWHHLNGWVIVKASGYGLGVKRVRFQNRVVVLNLTPPHTYTLAVRERSGKPISGLSVWAESLGNQHGFLRLQWLGYSGKTDARGEYQAQGLPTDGSVWFLIDNTRWSIIDRKQEGDRTIYTVSPGHNLEGFTKYPNGRPVSNVHVYLNAVQGTPHYGDGAATSDTRGRYRIQGLTAGDYLLRANPNSSPGMTGPTPTVIRIPETQTTVRKDIPVVLAVKVTGRVTDEQGKPYAGVMIDGGGNYSNTDADGRYSIEVSPGNVPLSIQGKIIRQITAQRGKDNVVNLTLPRGKVVRLHGTVTDSKGQPVPGLIITVNSKQIVSSTTSNAQGNFTWNMTREDTGPLTVFAHKGNEGAVVTVKPDSDAPIDLRLSESNIGRIEGQVVDQTGKPLPNVRLEVSEGRLTHAEYKPTTDREGRFSLTAIPNVPYFLSFHSPGHQDISYPSLYAAYLRHDKSFGFLVKPGETRNIGRIVMAQGKDTVTGRILWEGQPFQQGSASLLTPSGMWGSKTDVNGRFTLKNVIKGEPGVLIIYYQRSTGQVDHTDTIKVTVRDFGTINLPQKNKTRP